MKRIALEYVHQNKKILVFLLIFGVMVSGLNYSFYNIDQRTESKKIESAKAESLLLHKNIVITSKKAAKIIGIKGRSQATYSGLSKSQAIVVYEIKKYFGEDLFARAVKIAWCESRLNPVATNKNRHGTTDRGVFQINDGGTMQTLGINAKDAFNTSSNIRAAKNLYEDRGWQPWVCAGANKA